jgi:hypothetical protein
MCLGISYAQAMAQPASRVSATQKGSLLIFSEVSVRWTADGMTVLRDTVLDISNDYPTEVDVQVFFINGDTEQEEVCGAFPCSQNIIQEFEPGWNTSDCRFTLTANQPHYWSAANGSDKCGPFEVLDAHGPGRPDPTNGNTTRILRGYVIAFAVDFVEGAGPNGLGLWQEIRWNHLKGKATTIDYELGTAWEYNPWAFQALNAQHGEPTGTPGELYLDGNEYEAPFGNLMFNFIASGATALSGGGLSVQVDTSLTVHPVSADLRQDGCGPVLTKVDADIWNEFESKFSGARRCICMWDQTMLSDWVRTVSIPNHFTRTALRTDSGKARLDGVESLECDYEMLCGPTALQKRRICEQYEPAGGVQFDSENAAILGLASKHMEFMPSGRRATSGLSLAGAGEEPALIRYNVQVGPEELFDGSGRTNLATDGGHRQSAGPIRGWTDPKQVIEEPPAE